VTAAAGTTAAAARGRALLLATRAGYGVALVMAPSALIHLATGRSPGRRTRRVAQVLGARHLVQATVSAFAPMPAVLAAGAAVDALHAGSMIMLAISDRDARRVALTDALAETVFAAAGRRASTIKEELSLSLLIRLGQAIPDVCSPSGTVVNGASDAKVAGTCGIC
jgi:hypothetical protein